MKRRSFIGALVATFATPAKMLAPQVPVVPSGFVPTEVYVERINRMREELMRSYADCPTRFEPLFRGEIGSYNGIRIIRSKA